MKISQILNEFSEGAQPGVATTAAQTPQAQAAAQAIQKGLAVLQQQSPNFDASFNTTDAIQEIMPDGTVVMDSNLQPSALQNVRKILALGGGANFKVTMSTQTIPSATGMNTALQAKPGVAEGDRPFRGVGGAFNRGDDERHDLDPTDWYIVKDGKMLVASIYPRQTQQAIAQGFSRTRAEAKSRDNSQGVAEGSSNAVTFFRGEPILSQERLNQLKSSIGKPYPILRKEGLAANIGTYMSPDGDKATSFVKQALAGQGKGGVVTQIQVNPNSFSKGDGGIDEAVIITNIAGLVSNQTPNKNDPLRIQDRKQAMLKYLGPGVKKYLNDPLLSDPKIVQSWYNPEFAQKNWNTINSGKQAVTKPGESNMQERMIRILGPLAENIRRDPQVINYFISHNPGDWVEYNFRMNSDGSGTKVVDVKYYPPAKQGVAEEVNPDITSGEKYFSGPTPNVRMGDFIFNASLDSGGYRDPNAKGLKITAYDPKNFRKIGWVDFIVHKDKKGNTWLESDETEVDDRYQRKGVATMMYAYAKSLGNDIKPSDLQSNSGIKMWKKWGSDAAHLVGEQGVAEDSLGLKKLHDTLWTVISEQTIDEENINEIDPGMIANLYSVFPTVTKIIVSNALDKARKEAKETSIMIDVMKKHANNQPVTPEENEAMKSQFKDIVSYGLSAVAGVLTGAVAGPAAGVGVALAGAYKKELLTLLQTKGPEVLIGLLKSKGKLDVVDILSAKLLGKHALPFYAAPANLTTGSVNQGVAEGPTADMRAFFAGADSNRQPKWRPDPKTAKPNDIQLIIQKYKKLGADAITQDEYEKLKLYRLGKQLYEKAAVPVVANPDYMEENIKRE